MRQRTVSFVADALEDLDAMHIQIAKAAGVAIATAYMERLDDFMAGLAFAAERGTLYTKIRRNLRVVAFEKRVVIAFKVESETVSILRVFWGGQNWQKLLKE